MIVDGAHTIQTWGGTGFRKDFQRIGDMRVFLPGGNVMCAATATMSETVRKAVVKSLHIDPKHTDINFGCWRGNLRYGLRVMKGGQTAHTEICHFFDKNVAPEDTSQALIFVEDYKTGHSLADTL
ncbi:hypothetical protein FRC12_012669 [Ceratobasidium sp. 428]|nr:hypothetical protein FRC12_012669 [Ceratobasidium sp. 428]